MNIIRILETDDLVIDYDKADNRYRVSFFEDNHFVDEIWFDNADNRVNEIVDELELLKDVFKNGLSKKGKALDSKGVELFMNRIIDWIKDL